VIDTFNGALTLNQKLLADLRDSPFVVRQGLLVVLLVGLLVGGVNGVRNLVYGINPTRQAQELQLQKAALEEGLREMSNNTRDLTQRRMIEIYLENLDSGFTLAEQIAKLPTPLPHPAGIIAESLGIFASQFFLYLGWLLPLVVAVHLSARALGGQGSIQQTLGLGSLCVAPHALDALTFINIIGPVVGIVAWTWSFTVLVTATSVAHRLTSERSLMAVLLFPILGSMLCLMGCCLFFSLMATLLRFTR